jgi:hypothetical protein
MCSRQQRQPDGIDIFLQGGFGNLFGCLVQTCVDDFKTVITQCPRDGLGTTIVTIKARLGYDNAIWPLHR